MSTSSRVSLPFVCTALIVLGSLMAGCDVFGSGGGGDGGPPEGSVAALWDGEYEGTGQERDYIDGFVASQSDISPTLTIAFRDTQALEQLRLSWNEGESFAQTTGVPRRLTPDSLVTMEETEGDSVTTRFQFRLSRDSSRIEGTLLQRYEGARADSTRISFSVTPTG